eukprot:GEMP01134262.1.p2 GENE.GEMP01134262.1~~GEMP01134262.1.p2  ORF type:complete len:123 (+),score=33.98 GEMP01134262.1:3-371(+)
MKGEKSAADFAKGMKGDKRWADSTKGGKPLFNLAKEAQNAVKDTKGKNSMVDPTHGKKPTSDPTKGGTMDWDGITDGARQRLRPVDWDGGIGVGIAWDPLLGADAEDGHTRLSTEEVKLALP